MDITEHIKTNGLSRTEVCAKAGISRTHLSLIERNARRIGPSKVRDLAGALGCSIRDLRPDLADVFSEEPPIEGIA